MKNGKNHLHPRISIENIEENVNENVNENEKRKRRFFISLFDVLTKLKESGRTLGQVLENKLFYMNEKKRNTIIIQERQERRLNIKSVPQWYFNFETQKTWAEVFVESATPANKMYEYHRDVLINSSDNAQYRWKVISSSTDKNKVITLKREAFNDDGTSTGIIESDVPVWRVMLILNVMGKKKTKEDEVKEVDFGRRRKAMKGDILTIDSDYFTYFNDDYTLADMGPVREELYKVKKFYKKHIGLPWGNTK